MNAFLITCSRFGKMEGRDLDYRWEGWQQSAAPTYLTSSSRRRPSCAHRSFEAILVATCLVVAGASFLAAADEAGNKWSDLAFSNSISFMTGGFLALLAAMTRFGWLLNLSFLPSVWAMACQGLDQYGGSGNIAILTYVFDTCVVAIAVGVVVARCCQAQSGVDAYDEEDYDDGYDEEDNDDGIQAHSGPTRGTSMHKEIV
jgi:hypothetical protein